MFVVDGDVDVVEHFGSPEAVDGFSAEELFDRIGEAIDDGREVAVTYDEVTGLPSSLNLDLRAGPDDDPLILEIHSFLSYAEHLEALADARARWQAADLDHYRIRYEEPEVGFVEVDVRDGVAFAGVGSDSPGSTVTVSGPRPSHTSLEGDARRLVCRHSRGVRSSTWQQSPNRQPCPRHCSASTG